MNYFCSEKQIEHENEAKTDYEIDSSYIKKNNNLALRINEISLKDPSKLIKRNFIELKITGLVKVMNLQYIKIIEMTFDSSYQKPTIEMLVILHNCKTN
jgi:hypothetical protein